MRPRRGKKWIEGGEANQQKVRWGGGAGKAEKVVVRRRRTGGELGRWWCSGGAGDAREVVVRRHGGHEGRERIWVGEEKIRWDLLLDCSYRSVVLAE